MGSVANCLLILLGTMAFQGMVVLVADTLGLDL